MLHVFDRFPHLRKGSVNISLRFFPLDEFPKLIGLLFVQLHIIVVFVVHDIFLPCGYALTKQYVFVLKIMFLDMKYFSLPSPLNHSSRSARSSCFLPFVPRTV